MFLKGNKFLAFTFIYLYYIFEENINYFEINVFVCLQS